VCVQVCEVTKAAREILLKAMGEGLAAPTAAAAVVILDVAAVHKSLASTLTQFIPTPVSCAPTSDDVTLAGLSVSATGTQAASATVQNYVAQMAAHLVVYDTLPTPPLNGVNEDAWKYALATTETGQWKGERLPSTYTHTPHTHTHTHTHTHIHTHTHTHTASMPSTARRVQRLTY
jgi:hypothetical protein